MDYILINPYVKFQVKTEKPKREYLTSNELNEIRKKEIEIDRLNTVRNIFLFACYTGLSYADISKLAKHHIRTGNDGNQWIIIDRTKNDSRCRIPLLPVAHRITSYNVCYTKFLRVYKLAISVYTDNLLRDSFETNF